MSRITLNNNTTIAVVGEKLWIWNQTEKVGRYVMEWEIAELLKQKGPAVNEANSETTTEEE